MSDRQANIDQRRGYTMGEMISSFDGMKLYLNREVPENPKAALVIVHGLCEHQGRYDYLADISARRASPLIGLITGAMGAPRGRGCRHR